MIPQYPVGGTADRIPRDDSGRWARLPLVQEATPDPVYGVRPSDNQFLWKIRWPRECFRASTAPDPAWWPHPTFEDGIELVAKEQIYQQQPTAAEAEG